MSVGHINVFVNVIQNTHGAIIALQLVIGGAKSSVDVTAPNQPSSSRLRVCPEIHI